MHDQVRQINVFLGSSLGDLKCLDIRQNSLKGSVQIIRTVELNPVESPDTVFGQILQNFG